MSGQEDLNQMAERGLTQYGDHLYRKPSRQWRAPDSVEGIEGSWLDRDGHWNCEHADAGMDWEPDPSHLLDRKEFMETVDHCVTHAKNREPVEPMIPPSQAATNSSRTASGSIPLAWS
ncbi:MAG: hypothetical protein HOH33_16140 [Verrucomicrobia bacterium]|nr:hypothetical protein [Verrucomicrobiota bacterium]